MAKWWARAKTCSASLASKTCRFLLCLWGVAARCAVTLHFAGAVAVMAAHALDAHPLGASLAHQLPGTARRLMDRNEELQRALVLPWVLLGAAGALLWTACAILSLGRLLGRLVWRHACRLICKPCAGSCAGPCRNCRQSRSRAVTAEEEKDNGPPKIMSSAKVPTVSGGQHLRRRTYPKIM